MFVEIEQKNELSSRGAAPFLRSELNFLLAKTFDSKLESAPRPE